MFNVCFFFCFFFSPFDSPAVVSYHSFVPPSLLVLFHCFDIPMESFSLLIILIAAIIKKFILMVE